MEDLLTDAAFLANRDSGIYHFCINPQERLDFLRGLSRHAAAKPISQALDALLRGHQLDVAKQIFRNHLHDYTPKEEMEDLAAFVSGVNRIIERLYEIRKHSVTDFIRAKNALTAAIYTYTKYPELINLDKEESRV